jgi:hypothetical protein
MTTDHTGDGALSPGLEATAAAAHDRLKAEPGRTHPLPSRPDVAAEIGATARS